MDRNAVMLGDIIEESSHLEFDLSKNPDWYLYIQRHRHSLSYFSEFVHLCTAAG